MKTITPRLTSRLAAMKARVDTDYLSRRLAPALALAIMSIQNAYAQSFGGGMGNAVCRFVTSPVIAIIAAIAIIVVAIMLVLGEGKGLGSRVVQIIVGIAVIASIGTIVGWVVPSASLGC